MTVCKDNNLTNCYTEDGGEIIGIPEEKIRVD